MEEFGPPLKWVGFAAQVHVQGFLKHYLRAFHGHGYASCIFEF